MSDRARWWRPLPALLLVVVLFGCEQTEQTEQVAAPAPPTTTVAGAVPGDPDQVRAIEWDDLMPIDWQPETLLADFNADELSDDDPRATELMDKLRALWSEAPMVKALDGQRVRLPGFVVPLDDEAAESREFLLVPYFGACIHVPPPPPNQTVLVVTPADAPFRGGLFETVWVEGRLRIERFSHALGDAGYRIDGAAVTPYVAEE